jgi:citronellol/citronellal dehydrogenase
MTSLKQQTLFITGASRGIGLAIALRAARDGANIVIAAKTTEPHPKLPGTIYTAAEAIEKAGGRALPLVVDVREEQQIAAAVDQAVAQFGGIDILVNNASAISLTGTLQTPPRIYDRMMTVNTRGTFLCSQACIPALKRSPNPHILNLSPPLNMAPHWFAGHVAYTIAKYGMSLCVLGMAEELRADGIAVNALWPRTAIATAAIEFAVGDRNMLRFCRKPEILADAAHWILTRPSRELTGRFLIDDDLLAAAGVKDFTPYAVDPTAPLAIDFFLDDQGPHVRESIRLGENPPH